MLFIGVILGGNTDNNGNDGGNTDDGDEDGRRHGWHGRHGWPGHRGGRYKRHGAPSRSWLRRHGGGKYCVCPRGRSIVVTDRQVIVNGRTVNVDSSVFEQVVEVLRNSGF